MTWLLVILGVVVLLFCALVIFVTNEMANADASEDESDPHAR